ncbi:hypothetical protein ABW21_db0208297 [Orbilia brochopaga]|nr:hypothetical protein ABW21_db0208297 [Drechslerella brochopaga]
MHLGAAIFSATLVVTAAGAALRPAPYAPEPKPLSNYPPDTDYPPVWPDPSWRKPFKTQLLLANQNTSDAYVKDNDDSWFRLELAFPIQIFNKTSTVAWMSVNGIFSIDEPTVGGPDSVPEQPLPVDPEKCANTPGVGCLPGTAIAAFWRDMQLWNHGAYATVMSMDYTYHDGNTTPHYHVYWVVCDKAVSMAPVADTRCGKASRYFRMTFWQAHPGIFMFEYLMDQGSENVTATYGVQSYPDYLTLTNEEIFPGGRKCSLVYFDTIARTTSVGTVDYC